MKTLILGAAAALSAFAGGSKKPNPETEKPIMGSSQDDKAPPSVPRQLIVSFQDAKASAKRAEIFAKYQAKEIEKVGSTELYLIELPPNADLKAVQKQIASEPGVRYAEPNLIMRTFKN